MILCLTHSRDFYTVDIVQQSLEQAGYSTIRFNSDEFATGYGFNYSLTDGIAKNNLCIGSKTIDISMIQAVWYRKLWDMKAPPDLDTHYHHTFIKEYNTYRNIFFNCLEHLPWINKMTADHAVNSDKLQQLSSACKTGLATPKTIFTNNADLARGFFEQCNGNMVAKLHGALSKSMEGNTPFFPTTRLQRTDLSMLDGLSYCPMIFQEYIPKAYELRIVYIDGVFFTGKIHHEKEVTDWRTLRQGSATWQPYELPLPVQEKIDALMHRLDLVFGAIDMIRNAAGEYIFLEVNPQGEWGMLQKDLGYPIGETIAQKLINRIKNV